ncbi:MAG: cyanoexosortase B system-associated protein [Symploca sp. SIO2G7]|nr:cyanoexosortase B system-associated protein [Symploca sp. SIO2G7]
MKSFSLPQSMTKWRIFSRIAVVGFLLALVALGAVPGYWTGNWPWAKLPPVTNLKQIKAIRNQGLEIPGWQILEQATLSIGGNKWFFQRIKQDNQKPVLLLLLPQNGPKSQPQVEWADINGFFQTLTKTQANGKWQTDSYTKLLFTAATSEPTTSAAQVRARLFRAWNGQQTFAMVQWYASPERGYSAPSHWFWSDQLAQLHRRRVPWVAVCLQIPIEPLGDIEEFKPLAESLGQLIQSTLMAGPFARMPSPNDNE